MKKFWENFWDFLCWLACGVTILALIGIIVLACLGYDIESPIMKYFCYTCTISAVLFIVIFISIFISAMRTPPEKRIIAALEELDKQLAEEDKTVDPFEEFSDTVSMNLITGSGYTQSDYDEVDHLYLELADASLYELAEILSCEPEDLEKQLDTLNHLLHCIEGKWDKAEESTDTEQNSKRG